jgi:predicted naringenin-chalcone synthase
VITGGGSAVPAVLDHHGLWTDYFAERYRGSRVAERIWRSAGITTRHGVVDPRVEDVSQWGTGARMRRYSAEAVPLGKEAVTAALDEAGLAPADVGLLAVVSCTGYATPGLDITLARDLGMAATVQRLVVGHMGCYAAIPGLGAAADFVVARGRPAVLLCLELTSLHVQPAANGTHGQGEPDDVQQMVAHALFSDAAAAVVLQPGDLRPAVGGFEVIDVVALTDPSTGDHMTWDVTDLGFRMGLSPRVPDVLAVHVGGMIRERLLAPHGLVVEDVGGWAVHPGGRRILEVVAEQLDLADARMRPSYDVLNEFGNCSSATVLLVLDRLAARPGVPVVAMAFGPGLTLYAALLRGR